LEILARDFPARTRGGWWGAGVVHLPTPLSRATGGKLNKAQHGKQKFNNEEN